jgi:hypothetical protein
MPHDLHNGWLDPLHHGGAGSLESALKSWRMYRWIQPLEAIIAPSPQSRSDSPRSIVLDDQVMFAELSVMSAKSSIAQVLQAPLSRYANVLIG